MNISTGDLPVYPSLSIEQCEQLGYSVCDLYIFMLQWIVRKPMFPDDQMTQETRECMSAMIRIHHHIIFVVLLGVVMAVGERLVKWIVDTLCERGAPMMAILMDVLYHCFC